MKSKFISLILTIVLVGCGGGLRTYKSPVPVPGNLLLNADLVSLFDASQSTGLHFPGVGCAYDEWQNSVVGRFSYYGNLKGFTARNCDGSSGWNGTGVAGDPYRLTLNGDTNTLDAPTDALGTMSNEFTMELWVRPAAPMNYFKILAQTGPTPFDGKANQRYAVIGENGETYGPNHATVGISVATNGIAICENATFYGPCLISYPAPLTGWTHVVLVYLNRKPLLYLNGELVVTGLVAGIKDYIHPAQYMGDHLYGYGAFQGDIAAYAVYLHGFSVNEVHENCRVFQSRFDGAQCK